MNITITIVFSVIIADDNTYRLTAEVTHASNISTNIFLITNDGNIKGVCSPYDLYTYPDTKQVGGILYRTNIVTYIVQDNAEVIKVKNLLKAEIQDLVNKWSTIGDVIGQETWTYSSP